MSLGKTPLLAAMLIGVGCSTQGAVARPSVVAGLVNAAESADEAEACTAMLLLAHVALNDEAAQKLVADFHRAKSSLHKLVLAYVLDARLQYAEYRDAFVDLYPLGQEQRSVWGMKTNYLSVPSPLQAHLADAASTNERALDKLISGVPFADGSHAESLADEIQALLRHKPERVKQAFKRAGISPARLGITLD